jgi:hypothetical protein
MGLLEHTKENLDDTVFEDDDTLESILNVLEQGCHIAVKRMEEIMTKYKEDDCGHCCGTGKW